MKTLYFDCSSGISGDMCLGAFINSGIKIEDLKKDLKALHVKGYSLTASKVERQHVTCTKVEVKIKEPRHPLKPSQIENIIDKSKLKNKVKKNALKIFRNLCAAEGQVHGDKHHIHLHELGSLDTIVDIAGFALCLDRLNIKKIFFSNLTFGSGIIHTSTKLFAPAPAATELLKNIPARFSKIRSELVTPTGAAILKTMGEYVESPFMRVEETGYGAGSRDLQEQPNILRMFIGQWDIKYDRDEVTVMESAIDDTAAYVYTYLYDELFKLGALDMYTTAINMKKSRPGTLLTVITENENRDKIADLIFRETGTIGLRYYRTERLKLFRKAGTVKTAYGKVDVKMSGSDKKIYKISPEFESCKDIALKKKIPLMKVYEAAKKTVAVIFFACLFSGSALCDTIFLSDGSEVKGIVVEEYADRIVLSTEYGETEIPKKEIKNINYDLAEQNFVAIADKYMRSGDYEKAYFYYEKARQINPEYKDAVQGVNYLSGYLFRKELTKKASQVNWRQQVENFNKSRETISKNRNATLKQTIGVDLESGEEGLILISKVYESTPADVSGLKKGDVISSIWGELTRYLSKEEVEERLSKPELFELKIQIDRTFYVKGGALSQKNFIYDFDGLILKHIDEDSVLYKIGLRNGDQLLTIDNKSVRYSSISDVLEMLKGEKDMLVIRRGLTMWKKREG